MSSENGFGLAHLIRVGDLAIACRVDGTLFLIELNQEKFKQISKAKPFSDEARALPALSNGKLFWRTNAIGGKATLKCVVVGR